MHLLKRTLLMLGAVYLALALALFLLQRQQLYFPHQEPPPAGVNVERLQVHGADLSLLMHARAGDTALIYFGGNAEVVGQVLPALARWYPEDTLIAVEYRGYGGSTGAPSEAALVADALAVHDHLAVRFSRIRVIGRSLGSGIAIQLAAQRPVHHLVLVTPYASIVDVAWHHFPWLPVYWLLLDRYESWHHAPLIRAPTELVVAAADDIIPSGQAEKLWATFAPGVARLHVVAHAGHNDAHLLDPERWRH